MVAIANVKIWSHNIGVILWDEMQQLGIFEFDKNFLKLGLDIFPVLMPLSELNKGKLVFSFPTLSLETFKGLPGLLSDSLPDNFGNLVIEAWLTNKGKESTYFSPVDKLCLIANNGVGALEYEAFEIQKTKISKEIELQELINFVNETLNNKVNSVIDNTDFFNMTIVLAGENPKVIVGYNPKTDKFSTNTPEFSEGFESWIIKLDGINNFENTDSKIEYAYYLMALDCGIKMSECKLIEQNNSSHFMTKRFDRLNNQKIHMQTLCGLAHLDYKNTGFYSYEQAFQVLRELKLTYSDSEELYRRMVFNVMSRNQEDHTKNISFLMFPDGKWQLSPAYDLTYSNNLNTNLHQMSINKKTENILLKDLLAVAKSINIKKPRKIIEQCNEILFNWDIYAQKAGLSTNQIRQIERELIIYDL